MDVCVVDGEFCGDLLGNVGGEVASVEEHDIFNLGGGHCYSTTVLVMIKVCVLYLVEGMIDDRCDDR